MQQRVRDLAAQPAIRDLLAAWRDPKAVIDETIAIQAIPAPTFQEGTRAVYLQRRMQELGLADVEIDELGNVYGRTAGAEPSLPALMVSAHLDTVFPSDTDLKLAYEGSRIIGPGVGDNSLALGAMLQLAAAIEGAGVQPAADIWWVATVGEEGLGNLRGMRHVCDRLANTLGAAIIIEGIGLGRIYHAGLGVRRMKITINGPGGHSWLHAERPSAIHQLVRLGAALVDQIPLSSQPRAILNIGLISGGRSINSRAPEASFSLDLRSDDAGTLANLEARVKDIISHHARADNLSLRADIIGDRPSATLPPEHPLVEAAAESLRYLKYDQIRKDVGSTDANIPLARGIPSICISVTSGGNAHSMEEYIDARHIPTGMQHLTLVALLTATNISDWRDWNAAA